MQDLVYRNWRGSSSADLRLYRLVMLVESELLQGSLRPRREQVGEESADKRQGGLRGNHMAEALD